MAAITTSDTTLSPRHPMVIRAWTLLVIALQLTAVCGGYVRISERMHNVNIEQGGRAKFVCKVDVHPLDRARLEVTWKFKDTHFRRPSDSAGRFVYRREGSRYMLHIKNAKAKDTGVVTCVARVGVTSDMGSAFLQVKSVPDPPTNVKVSCFGNNAVLAWELSRDNGAKIAAYLVQFNTSDKPSLWYDTEEEMSNTTRNVTLQLYPWGTYSFRVISRNALGSSKPSRVPPRNCTTPPDRPDRNPSHVRTSTHRKKYLVIEWRPMIRLYFHGPRLRYQVLWRLKGTVSWFKAKVTDPYQGHLEVETNDVYRLYEIQVRAENSMGVANQPAYTYTGRSGESDPLSTPSNFSLNSDYQLEPHTAHFVWDTVSDDPEVICGKLKGYKLRYWKSKDSWNKTKEVEIIVGDSAVGQGQRLKVALSNLPAYTALKAQVAVMNQHYTGPYSDQVEFFTPEGVPTAVTNLRLQSYGVAYVLIKWQPPAHPNGLVQGFELAYQQVVGDRLGVVRPLTPHINDPYILGARITGLRPGRHYRFIVWARTKLHTGEPNFIDVMTAKGAPPHAPRMHLTSNNQSRVNITWLTDRGAQNMKYLLEYRHTGQKQWHNGDYVQDKNWVTLDERLPIKELEVRLVASNRLGDTATSRTVVVAKSLRKADSSHRAKHKGGKRLPRTGSGGASAVTRPHQLSHAHFAMSTLLPLAMLLLQKIVGVF